MNAKTSATYMNQGKSYLLMLFATFVGSIKERDAFYKKHCKVEC